MSWPAHWQQVTPLTRLARPLAALYGRLSALHQRQLLRRRQPLPVPVIVVGNIVVGGTGKTPMIGWLADWLRAQGHNPGIVSRGHGGRERGPSLVQQQDSAARVGDEPLLLAHQTGCPVAVGRRRPEAARHLLQKHPEVDVLISDDGLQHLALDRQCELCLFDAEAGYGNGELIPAGPLREPLSRLNSVDLVICKGSTRAAASSALAPWQPLTMALQLGALRALSPTASRPVPTPASQTEPVVALCGIGQPESFFRLLRAEGWALEPLALSDHGVLSQRQRAALQGRTVLMTSKDAIKLQADPLPCAAYEVPLQVQFSPLDRERLARTLQPVLNRPTA
ncbi:tetraacyldisaccharide 4'-kinase [Natronospirillum operosum]|uniref:Tetraacyldisaccharide 4'-kinase n=1 Tax=Natronospirillum operosum TaxID=2759953 RepID=A0A4Z0WBQ3_9GAMM|nr:tetraacyldisaccharide 4'-kinase [Natronospirillum operosum]TGG95582.1 tetraacyldisaccharide 4'-kinase [Natronospirillum operosum]